MLMRHPEKTSWWYGRHAFGRSGGFTLIELLIVIAIISLLVSILLPSLKKAKDLARNVYCLSNLRSISLWGTTYAQENAEVLPTNGGTLPYWYANLSGGKWSPWFYKTPLRNTGGPMSSALHCPQAVGNFDPWVTGEGNRYTYSLNHYLGGKRAPGETYIHLVPRMENLTASKYWFGDGEITWYIYSTPRGYSSMPAMDLRYNGQPWTWDNDYVDSNVHPQWIANFAYGDGHAESMPEKLKPKYGTSEWQEFTGAKY